MKKKKAIKIISRKCREMGITKPEQIQYIIATVEHETVGTFEPVEEAYYLPNAEEWRKRNLSYYPYYGRGLVQITHKKNYAKFGEIMGIDLVNHPELALDFDNSLFILIYGMIQGTFTNKKLDDYFNERGSDFISARKIINGRDKAKRVARLAQNIKISLSDEVL